MSMGSIFEKRNFFGPSIGKIASLFDIPEQLAFRLVALSSTLLHFVSEIA